MAMDKVSEKPASCSVGETVLGPPWTEIAVTPVLSVMIIPLMVLDLFLTIYHYIVFPLLDIPLVPRQAYIKMDRHRLAYLSPVQKIGCTYCGYANGLLQLAARIAGDTERYFCPMKHHASPDLFIPPHHRRFLEYGDEAGWRIRRQKRGKRCG